MRYKTGQRDTAKAAARGDGILTREKQADVALWDFGTREGATAKKVVKQMKDAGFSEDEILAAVERMQK